VWLAGRPRGIAPEALFGTSLGPHVVRDVNDLRVWERIAQAQAATCHRRPRKCLTTIFWWSSDRRRWRFGGVLLWASAGGFAKRRGESRRRASYSTTMSFPDTDTVPRPRGQTFVSILNVVPSPGILAKICWGPRTICPFSTS
jgi:hypothetical protein